MCRLNFPSCGSRAFYRQEAKWRVGSGSRINGSFTDQTHAIRTNVVYFRLVIPEHCKIREMITPATWKEPIDPAYFTHRAAACRGINQFLQHRDQFGANVLVLTAGLDNPLRFPAAEIDSDATLQIGRKSKRPGSRPIHVCCRESQCEPVPELPWKA